MRTEQPDLAATAGIAEALRLAGSVMVFSTLDGRMAATASGRTGYGPDRDAALGDLGRQLELAGSNPDL
jgi:hypothetical protein